MAVRALALAVLLIVLPTLAAAQVDPEAEGTPIGPDSLDVLGLVVDAQNGEPIEGVAVTLRPGPGAPEGLEAPDMALTNAQGRFAFRDLADGGYRIELSRIGYGTLEDSITYRATLGLRIEAELVPEAVELEPILVAVEARSRNLEARGFYRREARGIGRFITRDDIEERHPLRVTDLLVMVPGVRLRRGRGVGGETAVLMRGGCVADVFLDGVRTLPPFPLDSVLHPDDLAGIEVYHASELPAQYGISSCGALLVWTRLPEADELGNPFTWGRVLGALGFIVGAILLTR